jgi:hypothetical protein
MLQLIFDRFFSNYISSRYLDLDNFTSPLTATLVSNKFKWKAIIENLTSISDMIPSKKLTMTKMIRIINCDIHDVHNSALSFSLILMLVELFKWRNM